MSIEFDGDDANNQAVMHPTLWDTFPSDLTITVRFKLNKRFAPGVEKTFYLWTKVNKQSSPYDILRLQLFSTDGKLRFQKYPSSASVVQLETTQTVWNENTWYSVSCSYSTTSGTKLCVGGIEIDSNGNTAPVANGSDREFVVGALDWTAIGDYDFVLDGEIDDLRYYNRVLAVGEAREIADGEGSDGVSNGLLGQWRMDNKKDGTVAAGGKTVLDSSGQGTHLTPVNSPIYRAAPVKLFTPMGII